MVKKLADDLVHTNAEYEKLKGETNTGKTPRETPGSQGPGRTGYDKQRYSEWTQEELTKQAERLAVKDAEILTREELVEALLSRDATQSRIKQ